MPTRSLLWWIALVASTELLVRGHLGARAAAFHAGAWGLALLLGARALAGRRRARPRRAAAWAAVALALAGLSAAELGLALWLGPVAAAAPGARGAPESSPTATPAAHSAQPGTFVIAALGATPPQPAAPGAEGWPTALGQRVAAELRCARPVEVWDLRRADAPASEGSALLDGLPPAVGLAVVSLQCGELPRRLDAQPATALGPAPAQPLRASRLLAAAESAWRGRAFRARWRAALAAPPPPDLGRSECARGYRELLVAARERGVDVALVAPRLAVGADSPEAAIRALEAGAPDLRRRILAARLHERVVRRLAGSYGARVVEPAAAWPDLRDLLLRTPPGCQGGASPGPRTGGLAPQPGATRGFSGGAPIE